jgi:hypothetical protein
MNVLRELGIVTVIIFAGKAPTHGSQQAMSCARTFHRHALN